MMTKEKLLARKEELQKIVAELKESAGPVELDQTKVGRLSRMDAMAQQQMALRAKKNADQNLNLIEQALGRWENGDYGLCVECEEEISEARLKARPESALCKRCQENL